MFYIFCGECYNIGYIDRSLDFVLSLKNTRNELALPVVGIHFSSIDSATELYNRFTKSIARAHNNGYRSVSSRYRKNKYCVKLL